MTASVHFTGVKWAFRGESERERERECAQMTLHLIVRAKSDACDVAHISQEWRTKRREKEGERGREGDCERVLHLHLPGDSRTDGQI